MHTPELQIAIYQIAGDELFKGNRTDGSGWDWGWADWRRDWMECTPSKFAYRCLPLTIVNQLGWWIHNPVGFVAVWNGQAAPGQIHFEFDTGSDVWPQWINDQFGQGIITWNTPFLFRTQPAGSRLLICGPTNIFKHGIQPLTALIESDWMTMSFTMNWKFTAPGLKVRFEAGDPLFQAIPLVGNTCRDLERAQVTYEKLWENSEMSSAYNQWDVARRRFQQGKEHGEVRPDGWQRDYFRGPTKDGSEPAAQHMIKIVPPKIRRKSASP